MESIKFNDKGHSVEFSKRSLIIDNKEYIYTGISQVKHSSAYHAFLFRYKGEWVKLFYEEPHGKTIAALFKKINAMNARRAAKARATQSIDTAAIAAALAGQQEQKAAEAAEAKKPVVEAPVKVEEPAVEPVKVEEPVVAEPAKAEAPAAVEPVAEPAKTEEPPAEETVAEPAKAEEPVAEEPAAEPAVETPVAEASVETEAEAPAETEAEAEEKTEELLKEAQEADVKKAKRKKAFIIFAIILAIFIIAGIIYFLTMGTTNDSSQAPNVDETHQYNDIDELIEEMQE